MQFDCSSANWGSPPASCLHVAYPCTGWGVPGPSLPESNCRLSFVTVLTLCLLCSSLPPPSPCPSDFRTVVETAVTARKNPPGCRAQLVLQPLGPPCLSGCPAEQQPSLKDKSSSGSTRWICLQLYSSVFEDYEDGSMADGSTRLRPRCLWAWASPHPQDRPGLF